MKTLLWYYRIRPWIPRRVQILLRRALAARKIEASRAVWPIRPETAKPPNNWAGWPNKKKFAFVLSHDVDTAAGHDRCRKLEHLEEELGFRSSFNFVPEGYKVSRALRSDLVVSGFEVGVHGLSHDPRLLIQKKRFDSNSPRIKAYLKEWGAVGFNAPSMVSNLDWISSLDVEYDSSTFDTDPFEPISEGAGTIFPFVYCGRYGTHPFVELPYTLPQDHCLFIILKEKNIDTWKKKLAWIAANGGMALLNTHPDYMHFGGGRRGFEEYPAEFYAVFLEHIREAYSGQYWHVLPRELARFWKNRDWLTSPSE
jgi:hypothetical protein